MPCEQPTLKTLWEFVFRSDILQVTFYSKKINTLFIKENLVSVFWSKDSSSFFFIKAGNFVLFKKTHSEKWTKKTPTNCRTVITTDQFRNLVSTARTDTCRGKKSQFKILNVLIVFVMFKTMYLFFLHFCIHNYGQILYLYNKWNFVCSKTRILRNSSIWQKRTYCI